MAGQPVLYVYPAADRAYLDWLCDHYRRELPFAWQERVEETVFLTLGEADFSWPVGRLFGRDVEIRWERMDGERYALQLLTETIALAPTGEGWRAYPFDDSVDGTLLFLRGEHRAYRKGARGEEPDEWIETITPRPLRYPIRKARFARLAVVHYRRGGMVLMTRMKEVLPYG